MSDLNILHRVLGNPASLDGGVLRTGQVRELLAREGSVTRHDNLQIRADWRRYSVGRVTTWGAGVGTASFFLRRGFSVSSAFMAGLRLALRAGNLPRADVYALDHPIQLFEVPRRLRARALVFPHNLEILAYAQTDGVNARRAQILAHALSGDAELLAEAGQVVVISREEQWLLANLGVEAVYLPYLPQAGRREALRAIRQKRQGAEKKSVLVVGTAVNLPTLHGIRTLIETVLRSGINEKCVVIGKGTEALRGHFNSENVDFMGFVSSEELVRQQITCKALFVHQPFGTGVLTRIIEAVYSGIPVVANPLGGRSYAGILGVEIANDYAAGLRRAAEVWPNFVLPEDSVATLEAEERHGAGQVREFLRRSK
jgi:glycosyltransferase involved in cell wall biosynthesis